MEKSEHKLSDTLSETAETSVTGHVSSQFDVKSDLKSDVNAGFAVAPEKKRSWGNVIYDFGVFGSIAWFGVAALSALSAHESQYGKHKAFGWLRTINDKSQQALKGFLSKTLLKGGDPKTIDGYAKGSTMFLTLGMGGNALMAPIKWLEDHRQSNAAKIDWLLGTTPPDPEKIAHEPHQTWKSVFSGRLMSWGSSYLAFLAMGPALTDNISKKFGDLASKGWLRVYPKSNPQNVRRWADIIAFDALFTVITATATYVFSRYIAKKDEENINNSEEKSCKKELAAPPESLPEPAPKSSPKSSLKSLYEPKFATYADKYKKTADNKEIAKELAM